MAISAGAQEEQRERVEVVRAPRVRVMKLEGEPGRHAVYIGDAWGRGYLGVELLPLTEELRRHFGVPEGRGVMIARVVADGPAFTAGLEAADIVTSVDAEAVGSPSDLTRLVRRSEPGEEMALEVWRDGRLQTFTVAVSESEHPSESRWEWSWHSDGDDSTHPGPEVFERLQEYFEGEAWRERLQRFESLDWKSVEERMREVEERLRRLERQLDDVAEEP
jgi:hypothetical protein